MKSSFTVIILAGGLMLIVGCASLPTSSLGDNVRSALGVEYRSLKLPLNKPYIGAEWIIKDETPNRTKDSGVTELVEEPTVNNIVLSQTDKIASGIRLLYGLGPSAKAGIEIAKDLQAANLTIVKPQNIGDIAFKPGIPYVTEAIMVDNFVTNSGKAVYMGVQATNDGLDAGVEAGKKHEVGFSGNKLVIAYKVQKRKEITYQSTPLQSELDLATSRATFDNGNVIATLEYLVRQPPSISGQPFGVDVIWACPEAALEKDNINSVWVVTLKDSKQNRPIAFPASTGTRSDSAISGCKEFKAMISSEIISVTSAINRIFATIKQNKSTLHPDTLNPISATFDVLLIKETFELESF